MLERAFCNLVENAIKYNRPNGTVKIDAVREEGHIRVEISDDGIGIPPQLREQVFEPFFRVDKSRFRELGGAGLGLSMVRAIAERHGGRVWVEASKSGGSCFVVLLPCSACSAAERERS